MVKAEAEVLIERPCEQVFRFVAEEFPANYPRWSPEVETLEVLCEGPVQVGWLGRQVRVDRGRRSESEFQVTTFEHASRISFEGTTAPYLIDYQFESQSGQTRILFSFELTELSVALRPFRKSVAKAVQETTDRMVENLKALAESELSPAD